MRTAFKEWAIVVDALGRGDQILILRKGGIREGRGGFQVEYPRFLLYPTLFHQQRPMVVPEAQLRYDAIAPDLPSAEVVRLTFWAEVVAWRKIENEETAHRLQGQHIWREEVIADRFDWGKSKGIFALALRVYRLPQVVDLPFQESYGGCKSWIELAKDISTDDATPVLDDTAFNTQRQRFESALDPVASG